MLVCVFLTRTRAAWKSKRNVKWKPRFGICWASCMQLFPAPGLTWSGQSITSQEFGELPRQGKLVTESQSGAACHMKVTSSLGADLKFLPSEWCFRCLWAVTKTRRGSQEAGTFRHPAQDPQSHTQRRTLTLH